MYFFNLFSKELAATQREATAEGTSANYLCQWSSFEKFCEKYRIEEWPVSVHILCLYSQQLSHRLRSVDSIKNYLNGVKVNTVTSPSLSDFELSTTRTGLTKKLKHTVKQAKPITPTILMHIMKTLNCNNKIDLAY